MLFHATLFENEWRTLASAHIYTQKRRTVFLKSQSMPTVPVIAVYPPPTQIILRRKINYRGTKLEIVNKRIINGDDGDDNGEDGDDRNANFEKRSLKSPST
jgi:hypothetical protein